MAVSFVNSGAAVDTVTTTLTLAAPPIVDGDLLIANIVTHDNTAVSGQDARWNTAYAANNTTAQRFSVLWMIAATADSAANFNFTVAGTTHALGRISAYRGANGVGRSSSSVNASSATVTWATVAPMLDTSVILALFGDAIQTATDGGISAGSSGNIPTFLNRYLSAGTTDVIALYDAILTNGQATGARTMNATNAAVNTGVLLELVATAAAGTNSSPAYGVLSRIRPPEYLRYLGTERVRPLRV